METMGSSDRPEAMLRAPDSILTPVRLPTERPKSHRNSSESPRSLSVFERARTKFPFWSAPISRCAKGIS
jgi:hypothetical protein